MTAPFFEAAPLTALPVGLAFGAALERAGLGDARTIADQLAGRDFTVIKVMLSAIVTAMLLLFWSDRLGWLDLSRVAVPQTDLLPQLIGAVVFGAGFALASLCPGTACVAAATGARDGRATMLGLLAGTLITSLAWTSLGGIAEHFPRDHASLDGDLGLSTGLLVGIIVIMALLVWRVADRIEGNNASRRAPFVPVTLALAVLTGLMGNKPLAGRSIPTHPTNDATKDADHVDAVQLAEWIHDRRPGLLVIDIRDHLTADDYRLPGARAVPLASLDTLTLPSTATVVLYDDDGSRAEPGLDRLRNRGIRSGRALEHGLAGWENEVMAPLVPAAGDSAAQNRYRRVRPLTEFFGGMPRLEDAAPARARRRNTC